MGKRKQSDKQRTIKISTAKTKRKLLGTGRTQKNSSSESVSPKEKRNKQKKDAPRKTNQAFSNADGQNKPTRHPSYYRRLID